MAESMGPNTTLQMARLSRGWNQGEHVAITGGTGSGKTALARHVDQVRINRGGHVVVMVCKLTPDPTITKEYKGFTRWESWKKNPSPHDTKVLLWPKTEGLGHKEALKVQRHEFAHLFDSLSKTGKWTLHVDEGLYVCHPQYLNLAADLGMLHAMGRSSKLSIVTLAQRPAHLPLIIYSSASHAFVGRTREATDVKRLSEMGGKQSAKEMAATIAAQQRHDFLWVPVATDDDPEIVNIRR